ncbi:arginine/serine-rich protein 1 isoform X2 [Perognathus longimembris pacificus]|uniref:arginine/serine-rich protein 1 isoform X2 n=1 Tax=Perognathus longimembris pacificus TaxID=214514 RepID=UPI00201A1C91|nr:arginine/serine-rich protein 1 isoform X2 [Perognathus longimembris pacificus]
MPNYVNDLWPGSPQDQASPSTSRSRSRSTSRSSAPGSRASSRSSSRSRSRPRPRRHSRSRSRSRRRQQRKYRRYSRSYSRSRSRSYSRGRRYRERYRERYHERPRPHRHSRSRSRYGRSRADDALVPGRRRYGFGRTRYPEERPRWRARSRSRSRSRTPFRLTEKDRMELLEIAKANAAKALGTTNIDLPASLRTIGIAKEKSRGTAMPSGAKFELSEKQMEDGTKSLSEKSPQRRNIAFSANNSVAKPIQKTTKAAAEEISSGLPKIDKKKSPYGLWIPV